MAKLGGIVRVKWVDVDCATPNSHWPSHDFGSSHVGILTIETQMAQIKELVALATEENSPLALSSSSW